jgi:hypothetical protein
MELGKTLALFGTGTSWAEAMDQLMPEWMDAKPEKGKPSITFPDGQKERFDDIFLEAWGTFAAAHQADGIDLIVSYIKNGRWRKMTSAATKIQSDLKGADIFSLSDDQLRKKFETLFEDQFDGYKTSKQGAKITRGVGAELGEDKFIDALVEKVLQPKSTGAAAKGGARKRRSTRRKRVVKRKSGRKTKKTRKTRKTKKARKASRKTKKGRKTSRKTKKSRKAGRKTRKTTRKARKTSRKH